MEDTEAWKAKNLIKALQKCTGSGTSMISLLVPQGDQLSLVQHMLTNEFGTASNIKSRVNRLSVLSAITSAQQRLKLYSRTPKNGLIIFTGTVLTEDRKEKKIVIDFEPFKPVTIFYYMCDSRFHTEPLEYLIQNDHSIGFVIVDGNGVLYGKLSGSCKDVLNEFKVDLPKKHGRGGQSQARFSRLREEARHNYVRKVCENATKHFITNNKVNVNGIIFAGSADFKDVVSQSDLLDDRLKEATLTCIDIAYGGDNGFQQAIELTQDILSSLKYVQEKKVLSRFFESISLDSNKYVYGIKDTLEILETGAIETLIVWEDLEDKHGENVLIEWLIENHKNYGCTMDIVTDKSELGNQFVKGFGGVGGILRYTVELTNDYNDISDDEEGDIW